MKLSRLFASALLVVAGTMAHAADIEIKMLNKGADGAMVFEPGFVKAQPGDTIRFVPTDKMHDAVSIDGMLPEGVASFAGKLSTEFVLTVTEPGLYGVKCKPHLGMGMVALIQVGDETPANLEAAKAAAAKLPKKAKDRMAAHLAQVN